MSDEPQVPQLLPMPRRVPIRIGPPNTGPKVTTFGNSQATIVVNSQEERRAFRDEFVRSAGSGDQRIQVKDGDVTYQIVPLRLREDGSHGSTIGFGYKGENKPLRTSVTTSTGTSVSSKSKIQFANVGSDLVIPPELLPPEYNQRIIATFGDIVPPTGALEQRQRYQPYKVSLSLASRDAVVQRALQHAGVQVKLVTTKSLQYGGFSMTGYELTFTKKPSEGNFEIIPGNSRNEIGSGRMPVSFDDADPPSPPSPPPFTYRFNIAKRQNNPLYHTNYIKPGQILEVEQVTDSNHEAADKIYNESLKDIRKEIEDKHLTVSTAAEREKFLRTSQFLEEFCKKMSEYYQGKNKPTEAKHCSEEAEFWKLVIDKLSDS